MNQENNDLKICPICGRPTHKKSEYCIFHASAEEKTEEEFKKALKEYIEEIKEEDKDYDFQGFIFIGDIDFKNKLNITKFKEYTNFRDATFNGNVYFRDATFKGDVEFRGVTFGGYINFWDATFNGYTNFWGGTFKGYANFGRTTFKGDADFRNAAFEESVLFDYSTLAPGKKLNIKIKKKGIISFKQTNLESVFLDLDLNRNVLINFSNSLLKSTKLQKEQIEAHILQEKEEEFSKAKKIYLLLKNNFHSIGQYEDENWAFKKEKDMERKSNCHFKTLHKWLWSCFLNGIFGYGMQPSKVIMSAILIITLFAFLFMNPGISNVVGIEEITSNNFFDCIYFSTITFTTLGYGDFRPLEGLGRILAGSEAFIGAFMMALFVYTFARRTGGR